MIINDEMLHRRIITTTIDDKVLEAIAIRAVAEEANVDLSSVTKSRAYVSSRDTSTGIHYDMRVEIIIDLK